MKFEFEIERYWKAAIGVLAVAFIIMYIEPYGAFNIAALGISCLMTISIYKHFNRPPDETKPKKKKKKQ